MDNRIKILKKISENIDSGKVHIIFTPFGVDSDNFLLDVQKFLTEKYSNSIIVYYSPEKSNELNPTFFNSILSNNQKVFLLLNNLSSFSDPTSTINSFYGNENVCVIATTFREIRSVVKNELTDIRGRYISYFYPPFLYGDVINYSNDIRERFFNFLYGNHHVDTIIKVYEFILKHNGKETSFRMMYDNCGDSVSLVTFVDIVCYMISLGLFYIVKRINVVSGDVLDYGFMLYPTNCDDIFKISTESKDTKKYFYDALLIAKAFNDNCEVYRALFSKRGSLKNGKRVTIVSDDCLLIKNKNKSFLLKTGFTGNNDEKMKMFNDVKTQSSKIIVDFSNNKLSMNSDKILYCGIKFLLENGVF